MKSLSIEVSSIANVVTNGDFELWENNIPYGWTGANNDGTVGYTNTIWGLGVQFSIPVDSVTTNPTISQVIDSSNFVDGDSYTVGFWYRNDITINIKDSGGTTRASFDSSYTQSEWHFGEFNFVYSSAYNSITLQITKRHTNNTSGLLSTCYIDNIYLYGNDWYENRLPLKINQIKNFENFIREVEDDLFTFKSDALSFTIRNYGSDGSYFNTNDFETYSDRIFRFDILATYTGADGSDITKKMVLFSNNDTITKIRQPLSNDLSIQLYELSSLFKDNGWFLGRVVTDEETEETYFKYNTYSGESTFQVANGISLDEVVSNLGNDIKDLIRRHFIPVPLNDFNISESITNDENVINVNYDWLINEIAGTYVLIDIFSSPENRVFAILAPYSTALNYAEVWEIINGSTMKKLTTVGYIAPQLNLGELTNGYCVGFIHDTDTNSTYSGGENITFGVVAEYIVEQGGGGGIIDTTMVSLFTDNAGKPENDPNDEDIQLMDGFNIMYSSNWQTITDGRPKTAYFDNNGWEWGSTTYPEINFLDDYDPLHDNMLWLQNNNEYDGAEGTYFSSDITVAGTDYRMTTAYATTFNAEIYRFPRYYTFIFKDAYPSDVLKDLCVSQDALWYLDYSQTNDDITLTIKNRSAGDSSGTINDNTAIREDSFVRRIKFKDLDGTIFRDDATRLNYYLAYYNSTYGGGKFEKEFEMFGYRDYSIGDTETFDGNDYFIKRFELYTNERKTLVTIFQKAD